MLVPILGAFIGAIGSLFSGIKIKQGVEFASVEIRNAAREIAEAGLKASSEMGKTFAQTLLEAMSEFNANNQELMRQFNDNNRECVKRFTDCILQMSDNFNSNNQNMLNRVLEWTDHNMNEVSKALKKGIYGAVVWSSALSVLHAAIIGLCILFAGRVLTLDHLAALYDFWAHPRFSLASLVSGTVTALGYVLFWYMQYLFLLLYLANRHDKFFHAVLDASPPPRPVYVSCDEKVFDWQGDFEEKRFTLDPGLLNGAYAVNFRIHLLMKDYKFHMKLLIRQAGKPSSSPVEMHYFGNARAHVLYNYEYEIVTVPWNADGDHDVLISFLPYKYDNNATGSSPNIIAIDLIGILAYS